MNELATDFAEIIDLMNKHSVEYMVVGGYAVAFHGKPRFTEDFDIWIRPTKENCDKAWIVLKEFGFGNLKGLSVADLEKKDTVVQLGYPPIRIDILSSISGVEFEDAYPDSIIRTLGALEMRFIGIRALIKNKIASGREKDLQDAKQLKKIEIKLSRKKK